MEDEQDRAFAAAVELARERAKALYIHLEAAVNALSNSFDVGFEGPWSSTLVRNLSSRIVRQTRNLVRS